MRESISETERITTNTEASADRRNTDLAKHLAVGFTDKVTGKDPRAARAVAEGIERYTVRHPVPRGGRSKIEWLAGALAAMTVALQGCDDQSEDDILTRTAASVSEDVRTTPMTNEELRRRAQEDEHDLRRTFESRESNHTTALSILGLVRPGGEFDMNFANAHGGPPSVAADIYAHVSARALDQIEGDARAMNLHLPDRDLPALRHTLRLRIIDAINDQLNQEAIALDLLNTPKSEFVRSVRDALTRSEPAYMQNRF